MHTIHVWLSGFILSIIDFFYPWFKKLMPLQTFRYAACGGFNTSLDIAIYIIVQKIILHEQPVNVYGQIISAHIAAFLVGFSITFPIGFYLSRYVVFQETSVRKTVQLVKYFFVVLFCIILNYGFLKLFVEVFGWEAVISKLITTVFVVLFSYFSQKYFTFKSEEIESI
jgi:putative flippase GtrA